jgi:putative oxidoreductase
MRRPRIALAHSLDPGFGVAAVRIVMGLIFVTAGWGKTANGFGAVTANFGKMGMPAPEITGPFIALLELVGGALLLVGVAGRWLGLLFALEFVVATFVVKLPSAGWAGARLDAMLLAGGLLLFFAGSGRLSVDDVWLERRRA